ncbi:MAG: hypothetical protein HKM95_13195 [Inquilinus sp.]|nr:hypothetical protein [Inquilinus sp.]
MKLKRITRKLERFIGGKGGAKAPAIESEHVEEILQRLDSKRRKLEDRLALAENDQEGDRIRRKLSIVDEQRKRGDELLAIIRSDGG